ncbi:formylglycine-generating enzyme family protein [bacterium]|nr:formylglycine-generating enzyme family protein [bacterium]
MKGQRIVNIFSVIFIGFSLSTLAIAEDTTYTIEGYVHLQNKIDHSDTTVSALGGDVPTLGLLGILFLLFVFSLYLGRRYRGFYVGSSLSGLFLLITVVQAALVVITPSDGYYSLSPDGGGPFASGHNVLLFEHVGYYSKSVMVTIPEDGPTVLAVDNVMLQPINSGTVHAIDPIVGNMRYVPGGTFTQGSPSDEPCRSSIETQFNHTLTRNIAVMETEVTRQMWADLLAVQPTLPADPSNTPYAPTMSHPVNRPTWYETVLFANLLSLQNELDRCYYKDASYTDPVTSSNYTSGTFYCNFTASGYRLLSEGEWEYAARAGTTTPFSCNETNYTSGNCSSCTAGTHPTLEQYAVYCANDTSKSEPVGSKLSNPWNLSDMHSNVYEWCWDWYNGTYPGDTTDYSGPESDSYRVLRGGYWGYAAQVCRSASRNCFAPDSRGYNIGFRLVRSVN